MGWYGGGGYFGGGWGGYSGPSGGFSDIYNSGAYSSGYMPAVSISGSAYGGGFYASVAYSGNRSASQVLTDGAWLTGSTAVALGGLAVVAAPEITIPIAVAAAMAGFISATMGWAAGQ